MIASVLDMPPAGAVALVPLSMLTWHFELDGAVVEMEDDEPAQAAAMVASAAIRNCRARTAACTSAISLPQPSTIHWFSPAVCESEKPLLLWHSSPQSVELLGFFRGAGISRSCVLDPTVS